MTTNDYLDHLNPPQSYRGRGERDMRRSERDDYRMQDVEELDFEPLNFDREDR